ncbi:MAG: CbtB domain-containing protein [Halocynthiibacter sp.]
MENTNTFSHSLTASSVLPLVGAGIIGLFLVFLAGMGQAGVLHNAAHDVRHAVAFPCH